MDGTGINVELGDTLPVTNTNRIALAHALVACLSAPEGSGAFGATGFSVGSVATEGGAMHSYREVENAVHGLPPVRG